MSQDVSTNQGVREPLTAPTPIQPWSAEAEADKLMDELFSDIDRILEGGSKLPTEPVKPEYISLQPIAIPQITMPPAVIETQELLQQQNPEDNEAETVETLGTDLVHTPSTRANRFGWSFEKVLLAVGLASIVGTIVLLLTSKQKLTWPWSQNGGASQSNLHRQPSDSDKQFMAYMLRSLDVIDHKTKAKQQTPSAPEAAGTNNPPTIPVPSNRTLNSNQAPTVLERVYIPVPQGQMPLAPAALPPAARPAAPVPSAAARPAALAPSKAARPTAAAPLVVAAKPTTPAPSRAARPPAAAKPTTPAPSKAVAPAPALPPAAVPPSTVEQSAVPAVNHTLVGLVEIGDRPVALINIDGVVQRLNVGESIGNTGWTLVSIGNQQAVIRRNGEVRSVYAGQKF